MLNISNSIKTRFLHIALGVALVCSAPVMAKKGNQHKFQQMRHVLAELNLSTEQKQDIRQLMRETRADNKLFKEDAKLLKSSLKSLIQSDLWQQTEVENIIAQQHNYASDQALEKAQNKNQVWNLLSAEQQAEFTAKLEQVNAKASNRKKGKDKKARYLKRLNLSDSQSAAIEAIKAKNQPDLAATRIQMKTFKQAERALIQNPEFDSKAWQQLWEQHAAELAAVKVAKAKVKHDIWQVLTAEQQAKVLAHRTKGKKRHAK